MIQRFNGQRRQQLQNYVINKIDFNVFLQFTKTKDQVRIIMAQNSEIETPTGQSQFLQTEDMSPSERAIYQMVLALSLEESNSKFIKKENGLCLKYRKAITNMKMTKSSQKCTICYSEFCSDQIIKRFPCKHIFHRQCAKQWLKLNKNCPNCRLDLHQHYSALQKQGKLPIIPQLAKKSQKIKDNTKSSYVKQILTVEKES